MKGKKCRFLNIIVTNAKRILKRSFSQKKKKSLARSAEAPQLINNYPHLAWERVIPFPPAQAARVDYRNPRPDAIPARAPDACIDRWE
jgi:hypothetical protein